MIFSSTRLNLQHTSCVQGSDAGFSARQAGLSVKIIKPAKSDPILLHSSKPGIATILIRFLIFLGIAVIVLVLAWIK